MFVFSFRRFSLAWPFFLFGRYVYITVAHTHIPQHHLYCIGIDHGLTSTFLSSSIFLFFIHELLLIRFFPTPPSFFLYYYYFFGWVRVYETLHFILLCTFFLVAFLVMFCIFIIWRVSVNVVCCALSEVDVALCSFFCSYFSLHTQLRQKRKKRHYFITFNGSIFFDDSVCFTF